MSPTKYAIAICDDEKYWQNQILNCCKLLENDINFNFEYHIFSSGEDVLKYQSNIDILLLDEELPGTSGQSIKEQFEASNKNTIIIFITSHNEIVYDSFGKNVYGFITKPINQTNFNKTLKKTINKTHKEVKQIIKKCTIVMWIFEVIIVLFKVITGGIKNINNYVPLYYCSLLLYAGLLSSFAKNELKRMGDVFLATGGIIGGIVFILYPSTSLPTYPAIHIVSLHSFVFHGIMIYLGLLINKTKYIEIQSSDIKYYFILVGSICVLAYIVNNIFGSNLMFISKNFPGTPIEIIYNISGKYFTLIMSLGQMILPFYIVYEVVKQMKKNEELKEQVVLEIKS